MIEMNDTSNNSMLLCRNIIAFCKNLGNIQICNLAYNIFLHLAGIWLLSIITKKKISINCK